MPSLEDLVRDTMLITAARGAGRAPTFERGDFLAPEPHPFSDNEDGPPSVDSIRRCPIWQFDHESASPGVFRNVRLWSRGMGMNYTHPVSVMRELSFSKLEITRTTAVGSATHRLPIAPEFVFGTWSLDRGEIPESDVGLWQLPANTDVSLLIGLAYQLVDGEIVPLPEDEVVGMGDGLMPAQIDLPPNLQHILDIVIGAGDTSAMVTLGECRYVVFLSLTTCKESDDFAPGGLVGMARFYPHAMVMANESLEKVEVSIRFERDAKAMTHGDPEMMADIKGLLVTDSNEKRALIRVGLPPVPFMSNIFDYYVTDAHATLAKRASERSATQQSADDHPDQGANEVTLADARFNDVRRLVDGRVTREGGAPGSIEKWRGQGQFDNVHLAPRMRLSFRAEDPITAPHGATVELDDIAMVFLCMHDCVHLHARWAGWSKDKITLGFSGGRPFAAPGAPAVPENQTVFSSFPDSHTHVYRAVAYGCEPGAWQVFCHHGAAYAIDEWPTIEAEGMRRLMRRAIFDLDAVPLPSRLIHPTMPETWAAFYWRCRWMGVDAPDGTLVPQERLRFDLDACLR